HISRALLLSRAPHTSTSSLFPYTTLSRSLAGQPVVPAHVGLAQGDRVGVGGDLVAGQRVAAAAEEVHLDVAPELVAAVGDVVGRSEEHTSELQSRENIVCRLLLEKKK